VVAVPPEKHFEVALACLEEGCHVLLEKPLCPSAVQARELARLFHSRGLTLFGGHSERFHPVFLALREGASRLGRIRRIECVRLGPEPPKCPEGGALLDLGIHDLDLLQRLVGAPRWSSAHSVEGVVRAAGEAESIELDLRTGYAPRRERRWILRSKTGTWSADFLEGRLWNLDSGERIPPGTGDALEREHAAFLDACTRGGDDDDLEPQLGALDQVERLRELLGNG
jgi:predicted dehydrogenase